MIANEQDSPTSRSSDSGNYSGTYGFSRNEIKALLSIFGLIVVLSIWQWWTRAHVGTPSWATRSVVIEKPVQKPDQSDDQPSFAQQNRSFNKAINLNTATNRELIRLPGIGPALAQRIIEDRREHGPYSSVADLQRVRGIGPKTSAALVGWVSCDTAGVVLGDRPQPESSP